MPYQSDEQQFCENCAFLEGAIGVCIGATVDGEKCRMSLQSVGSDNFQQLVEFQTAAEAVRFTSTMRLLFTLARDRAQH